MLLFMMGVAKWPIGQVKMYGWLPIW